MSINLLKNNLKEIQMKIKNIHIENFRSIKDISLDLSPNLNVLVGVNGAGKTSILESVSTSLSWIVNRIQRQNSKGNSISDGDIRNETDYSRIEITIDEAEKVHSWKLFKGARGTIALEKSNLNDVSNLAQYYQKLLSVENKLPVIAYYPVSREVERIMPEIKGRDSLYTLDVYDKALSGKRDYQAFFEWFRLQDDILNEQSASRSIWFRQNSGVIKRQVKSLLNKVEALVRSSYDDSRIERFRHLIEPFDNNEIYNEPRYLFSDLSRLISMIALDSDKLYKSGMTEIQYIFHQIEIYSRMNDNMHSNEADSFNFNLLEETLEKIIKGCHQFEGSDEARNVYIDIIWELFVVSNTLIFWWLNEKGRNDLMYLLRRNKPRKSSFLKLFSNSEIKELSLSIEQIIHREIDQRKAAYQSEGRELEIVRNVIEQFIPEYSELRVQRTPHPHMRIDKDGKSFDLSQMSDGEKNLITLVGDIARRLAIANPTSSNPLEGNGIILIDEIDLHLHPKWQRLMIPQLTKIFPNCQFIITTHSPQVLGNTKPENIFILEQIDGKLNYRKIEESFGMSVERVIELIMDDSARPEKIQKDLDKLFELIGRKRIKDAIELITVLKNDLKTDPDILRAELLIRKAELK